MLKILIVAMFAFLLFPGLSPAGPKKGSYNYRQSWYEEGQASEKVYLLLHFGETRRELSAKVKKQIENWEKAKERVDSGRKVEKLVGDVDNIEEGQDEELEALSDPNREKRNWAPDPLNLSKLGPEEVKDFSWHRQVFKLGDGVSITEKGKFGTGLECSGEGRVVCSGLNREPPEDYPFEFKSKMNHAGVSAWVKIDEYPEETQCILHSIGASDLEQMDARTRAAKLLLHPDGKVELRLRHRHGHPRWQSMTGKKDAKRAWLNTPVEDIVSKKPIPTGEWVWIRMYNNNPIVQGPGCYRAELSINNVKQDSFLTPRGVQYSVAPGTVIIGNSLEGDQGFEGLIDDVKATNDDVPYLPTPSLKWRDLESKREVSFGKPHLFRNGAVFHAPLGESRDYDFHKGNASEVEFDAGAEFKHVTVPGVRGQGWRVKPSTALPRVDLKGMNTAEGSVEFWFRPVNFDNATRVGKNEETGKLTHYRPLLSGVRLYGDDGIREEKQLFLEMKMPRGRLVSEPLIHPNDWFHVIIRWDGVDASAYINGKRWKGKVRLGDNAQDLKLETMELGITDKVLVKGGEPPRIDVDEIAGYNYALHEREIRHAPGRWKRDAGPIPLYSMKKSPRWRLGELDLELSAKFPPGQTPEGATVSVRKPNGDILFEPAEKDISTGEAKFEFRAGRQYPQADYTAYVKITNAKGQTVVDDTTTVDVTPPELYSETAGVLETPPPPWTPVEFKNRRVKTRKTEYVLQKNGLPKKIIADGKNLLSRPVYLEENGQRMKASSFKVLKSTPVKATWETTFRGETTDLYARWDCDYDGCVKYSLLLEPKGKVAPITMVIPIKKERAKRFMHTFARARGAKVGVVPDKDGVVLNSRRHAWRKVKHRARRRNKNAPSLEEFRGYAFANTLDVNDLNRGLYWFADNAIGWWQSDTKPAQTIEKKGDEVLIRLNLVAEPVEKKKLLSKHIGPRWAPAIPRVQKAEKELKPHIRPIVFGVLPHPARPLADHHRLMDRAKREENENYCNVYDTTFMTWPIQDRGHGHRVWPKKASWEIAEKAREAKEKVGLWGSLLLYHGWWFMGFRGGGPDYWEMYSSGHPSFTPDLVDHLCYEWDQWVGRGLYEGWYGDEDYQSRLKGVDAGLAVRLPNGKVQPGEPYWGKRAYAKRSRNISHQHDKEPAYVTHSSVINSFNYSHLVFVDSYLMGEGQGGMIGGRKAPGFVKAVPLKRVEVLQNARLWGVTPAWYACIWEYGKETDHKRWAWRMARGCNSVLAHLETFVPFCETSGMFDQYWRDVLEWGAMYPQEVPFVPYWNTDPYLDVEGMRDEVLVSFYKGDGRILLIASNRNEEAKDIRVKLDIDALGLSEDATVKRYDRSYPPAEGEDFLTDEEIAKRKKAAEEALEAEALGGDSGPVMEDEEIAGLLGGGSKGEEKKKSDKPRFEDGNVLVVPTRGEDFSLISVE